MLHSEIIQEPFILKAKYLRYITTQRDLNIKYQLTIFHTITYIFRQHLIFIA